MKIIDPGLSHTKYIAHNDVLDESLNFTQSASTKAFPIRSPFSIWQRKNGKFMRISSKPGFRNHGRKTRNINEFLEIILPAAFSPFATFDPLRGCSRVLFIHSFLTVCRSEKPAVSISIHTHTHTPGEIV